MHHRGYEPQRLTDHAAGRFPMAFRIAQLGLGTEQHGGMVPDPERHRTCFAAGVELAQVARVVRRGVREPGHLARTFHPATLDGGVVDPGVRVVGGRMRGRQVRTRLRLVLREHRQRSETCFLTAPHHLLDGRLLACDHDRRDRRTAAGRERSRDLPRVVDAERACGEPSTGREVGHHRDPRRRAVDTGDVTRDQHRMATAGIQLMLQRGQFMTRRHRARDLPDSRCVLGEELAQIGHIVIVP